MPILTSPLRLSGLLLTCVACTAFAGDPPRWLLFGEQHDQVDQKVRIAAEISHLANRGELAGVVLEMADRGRSTRGLPLQATDAQIREALGWSEKSGWPWADYAPVVRAAVAAGVTVWGGNLPRQALRPIMNEPLIESLIGPVAREKLAIAVRDSHCRQIPPDRVAAMVRVQIARDAVMAQTLLEAGQAGIGEVGGTDRHRQPYVLLLAGEQHVGRDRGIPLHLQSLGIAAESIRSIGFIDPDVSADSAQLDERRPAAITPREDPCAEPAVLPARPASAAAPG
jgi:uncharacterized iron-regulated protein